jgi:hypothetical protein
MRIKFVGGREVAIIRDITDPRFNHWRMGEVKDVPDHDIDVLDAYGLGNRRNAIDAVLNAGFDFVDEETGKNPLFTCTACGERAEGDFFILDHRTVSYRDHEGDALCVPCFLAQHPEHIAYHVDRGMPAGMLAQVEQRRAAAPAAAVPVAPAADPVPEFAVADDAHASAEE